MTTYDERMETTLGPVEVRVDLTAPQNSMTGRVLHRLLYNNQDLYDMAPNAGGCPHNGGEHSFYLTGPRLEVIAWLDLFKDIYPTTAVMVDTVKGHIRKQFIDGDWRKYNRINVKLKTLERLERKEHQDQPVSVKWFHSEVEKFIPMVTKIQENM